MHTWRETERQRERDSLEKEMQLILRTINYLEMLYMRLCMAPQTHDTRTSALLPHVR